MTQYHAENFPLAPSQIPEWYVYQLAPDSSIYNVSFNHFFFSDVDIDACVKAWLMVIARHDVFRIRFANINGEPSQQLGPKINLTKDDLVVDNMSMNDEDVKQYQTQSAEFYAKKPFDLINGLPFRLKLIIYPNQEVQLIFTVHHIIWDETSTINVVKEFSECYNGIINGRDIQLPEISISYLGYVSQEKQHLDSGLYETQKNFWHELFNSKAPPDLNLPSDYSRSPIQTYSGDTHTVWLDRLNIHAIQKYLMTQNITLYTLFISVFALYAMRVTQQKEFVIGTPIAGRKNPDVKNLLGCFAKAVPIYFNFDKSMSFVELIQYVQSQILGAFDNSDYPSNLVIENLDHKKDLSRPKLFSVMAGVQNNKSAFLDIELAKGRLFSKDIYSAENHGARFDIAIGLDPIGSDIKFFCTFNTDLFRRNTIEEMMENIQCLMGVVVQNDSENIFQYPIVSQQQRSELISKFASSRFLTIPDVTVGRGILKQALQTPTKTALIRGDNDVTYQKLMENVEICSGKIISSGVKSKDNVGLYLYPGIDQIIVILSLTTIGACYIPIDIDACDERIDQILKMTNPKVIICDQLNVGKFDQSNAVLDVDSVVEIKNNPRGKLHAITHPSVKDVAYILFTTGTTGLPKGVPIKYQGITNLIFSLQNTYGLNDDDKFLQLTSYCFDPYILEVFWPLLFGASVVIPDYAHRKDADEILETINKHEVTILQVVPTMLSDICRCITSSGKKVPSLRLIICGSEVLPVDLIRKVDKLIGCNLSNHYGPTELTVDALFYQCQNEINGDSVPIGKPIDNVKVFITDSNLQLLPRGGVGEILISSPGQTDGYLAVNSESIDSARFLSKGAVDFDSERLFRTGDLGRFDIDGNVHFCGRVDNQIKVNGNRVELDAVSSCLIRHPGVHAACVRQVQVNDNHFMIRAFVQLDNNYQYNFATKKGRFFQWTLAQKPELRPLVNAIHNETWPEFFEGSPVIKQYWNRIYQEFSQFQFCLLNEANQIACLGNGIPLFWDGTPEDLPPGWDEGVERAFQQKKEGVKPNTILGLAGIVVKNFKGLGLSQHIVKGFRHLSRMHKMDYFLGPVRPIGMIDHNMYDLEKWSSLKDENNEAVDYWLRVHHRLGADQLSNAPNSQKIVGTLQEWQKWTGHRFDKPGEYFIDTMLGPVVVHNNMQQADYYDPSIWVAHRDLSSLSYPKEHLDRASLNRYLSDYLPAYMLPNQYVFMDKLPLVSNGKMDVNHLDSLKWLQHEDNIVPASTNRQALILEYWKSLLEVDELGIESDFFVYAGQSLQAIKLLDYVEKTFCVRLSLKEFYQAPSVLGIDQIIGHKLHSRSKGEVECL